MAGRNKKSRREQRDLDERLQALRSSGSSSRKRRWWVVLLSLLFGLALVAVVLAAIFFIYTSAIGGSGSGAPEEVSVVKGDTLSSVADKLKGAGIIESATVFKLEARAGGNSADLKPGSYKFRPGTDSTKILKTLTANKPAPTFSVTIPEGLTIKQTADEIASQSKVSAKDFEAAARETNYSYGFLKNKNIKTTEGFLFPKQYDFEKGANAHQMVDRFLNQYLIETENLDFGSAEKKLNLNEYEIVTVASLVERESASPEERPLIASVIYNRLRQGMPLQIDASVQYALGKPKAELSLQDLKVNSPYNTYENSGLPPGPICSPSLDSIQAALKPAKTDYLYYVLNKKGTKHTFTSNYDDFLKAKAEAGR